MPAFNSRVSATHGSTARKAHSRGWTGALGRWRGAGKLTTDLNLTHDRSVGQADFDSTLTGETSDSRASDIASLAVTWAATAKISFTPRASYARRKLDNSFANGGIATATGTDTTVIGGLSMTYTPFDALSLVCQVTHERRTTDSALSTAYKATVAGCNAEFAIR
ncbi:MAG: hypothetical protein KF891_02735 [Rhizobacter sp.]|nr:hypothetical protein [Rhizobacter sp.]